MIFNLESLALNLVHGRSLAGKSSFWPSRGAQYSNNYNAVYLHLKRFAIYFKGTETSMSKITERNLSINVSDWMTMLKLWFAFKQMQNLF